MIRQRIELPKYVVKAITSQTAKKGDYAIFSQEEWMELAKHIRVDETMVREGYRYPYFSRGSLNVHGMSGIKSTLNGLLILAIDGHEHSGFWPGDLPKIIPHYNKTKQIYRLQNLGDKLHFTSARSSRGHL